jgi:hypothetical protein
MWHVRGTGEMHTGFGWGTPKIKGDSGDLGIDGNII